MNYKYILQVINEESENLVGKREFSNKDLIIAALEDTPIWIKHWEDSNTAICVVCGERKLLDNITFKDTDENREEPICNPCAEQVIDGSVKLPEVVSEDLEKGGVCESP